jgi:hypothetical protein
VQAERDPDDFRPHFFDLNRPQFDLLPRDSADRLVSRAFSDAAPAPPAPRQRGSLAPATATAPTIMPPHGEPEERDTDEEEGQPLTVFLAVEGRPDIDRAQRHELPSWALGDDVKLLLLRVLREHELPDYGTDPSDWELFYDGFPWKGAWPLSEIPETPIYMFIRGLAPP